MEETYISFETAKLAKEKGIDLPHTHYYVYPFRSFKATGELKQNATNDDLNHNLRQVVNTRKMQPHMAPAYSQSALQKWLREEHGIHIVIIPTVTASWTYKTVTVLSKRDNDVISGLISVSDLPPYKEVSGKDFSTYEEALEDAEFEALKLLK